MESKTTIKAKLPKGFEIEVQESKNWLPKGILVLVNDKNQRLYVKIAKPEDILKGIIFEVLTPEECKELNIEETYNQEVYVKKRLYQVEESASEDSDSELWNPDKETIEEFKERTGKSKGKISAKGLEALSSGQVHIHLNSEEKGKENFSEKFGSHMLETLKQRCLENNVEYIEPTDVSDVEALLSAVGVAEKRAEREALRKADPIGSGSSGQIPLSNQHEVRGSRKQTFSSHEEMVNFLAEVEKSGSEEEKKEAHEILNELWRKTANAIKNEGAHIPTIEDKAGEKSFIAKALERANRRYKKEKGFSDKE
jgi:hypothetical protein